MKASVEVLTASDGHSFDCYTVNPEGDVSGGLVILQEIFGITDQLKRVANRYAALGYRVAIPALFDRQARNSVIPFDQGKKGLALMEAAELDKTLLDINSVVMSLRADLDKVVVMGFCWGGGLALRTAQKLDIDGAIVFYGTRLEQYLDCPLKVSVLGHFGNDDPHVPDEVLTKATHYLPELRAHVYPAGHAFANDARDAYVKSAADLAHERNVEYLQHILGKSA